MNWIPERIAATKRDFGQVETRKSKCGSDVRVIHTESLEALVQYLGYLKYIAEGPVFFRGQKRLYDPYVPKPTALRKSQESKIGETIYDLIAMSNKWGYATCGFKKHKPLLSKSTGAKKGAFSEGMPLYAIEPLLQHYGFDTRWLDLTDSLSHALLFSVVEYEDLVTPATDFSRYQLERDKSPLSRVMCNKKAYIDNSEVKTERFSYIYAICPGKLLRQNVVKGVSKYEDGWIMDARVALASQYLRPHAQHGLLLFPKHVFHEASIPLYSDHLSTAVFEVPREKVLSWLGKGELFDLSSVYPRSRMDINQKGGGKVLICDSGLFQWEKSLLKLRKEDLEEKGGSHYSWGGSFSREEVYRAFSRAINYICN